MQNDSFSAVQRQDTGGWLVMGFPVLLKPDPECKLDPVLATSKPENKHVKINMENELPWAACTPIPGPAPACSRVSGSGPVRD